MRSYVVVTYLPVFTEVENTNGDLVWNDYAPSDYFSRDDFESALDTLDAAYQANKCAEIWMHDPTDARVWYRISFTSNSFKPKA